MEQKTKLVIIIIAVAVIAGVGIYTIQRNKISYQSPQSVTVPVPAEAPAAESVPAEVKSVGTTVEGMIISLGEKNIAISNNTSEPALIGITNKTPVVKIGNDEKEIEASLADIVAGENARVLYDENKEAKKIYLLGK